MPKAKITKRNKRLIEVLGPVDDLESYVKADWWLHLFNANYLRTDGDVVEDEDITRKEVDKYIDALGVSEGDRILDLCCGQGRHAIELAKRGFSNVEGLDRSHYLINRARKIKKTENLQIFFREGDARRLPYVNDSFNAVIIAGNSFGYFESLDDDIRVLKEVLRVLKPGGGFLIDITDGDYTRENYLPRGWEWVDKNYFVCRERSLSKDGMRLISREVVTHVTKGVVADQFYAERLYTLEQLVELMTEAGFAEHRNHARLLADSKRNQDLGMMAERMLVTAVAQKAWTVPVAPSKDREKVLVLLGDPKITDVVKPDAQFDNDDYHTINELKRALSGLSHYEFTYLSDHESLLRELINIRGTYSFVFNLCDEGFNNEASKELHISALLEILGINYTGGTPQCLAYCYDKSLIRGIAREMDIPVPEGFVVKPEDIHFVGLPLQFPVIVKPNFGDSSFGITKDNVCCDIHALEKAIMTTRDTVGYEIPILVEEYLAGKDLSVGIIGNPLISYTTLPIIEEDYSALPPGLPRICGYEAKWDPGSPYWNIKSIPAHLSEEVERFLQASCVKLVERLHCRDYARFDWRLDDNGTPRLLEVNPNPGWCWDGHLAKMAALEGKSYDTMLDHILGACRKRISIPSAGIKVIQ
ncbi:MAG: methyltransferase domain-containing protein [Desulfofustis sp.]